MRNAVLFIDTASASPSIALCDVGRTLACAALHGAKDNAFLPALESVLGEAKLTREDLGRIACTVGPGGFTSLRVGITAANMLGALRKLPLAGIHLSDLWAVRVRPNPNPNPSFLWLHSTRRNALFARGFGTYAEKMSEATLLSLDEAKNLEGSFVGELLEEHRGALPHCTPFPGEQIAELAEALPAFLQNLQYGEALLTPWYGREA